MAVRDAALTNLEDFGEIDYAWASLRSGLSAIPSAIRATPWKVRSTARKIPSTKVVLAGQPSARITPTINVMTAEDTIQPQPDAGRKRNPMTMRRMPATIRLMASNSVKAPAASAGFQSAKRPATAYRRPLTNQKKNAPQCLT